MNRLEGMLINRRAGIVRLRHDRMNGVAPILNAHAGWWVTDYVATSKEEFRAKTDAISADLHVLDQDQQAYALTGQAEINSKYSSGKCTGKISPTTGVNDCLSDADIKFQTWYQAFNLFKDEWNAFLAGDPGPSDDGVANQKALRLKSLREDYERISKRKLAVSAAPKEEAGGSFFGSGGSETAQTLNSIVWLVGLGFAFFIFTSVAAPLLGGAARTKEQWRQLRN